MTIFNISNIGLAGCGVSLFLLTECEIKENLKAGCGMVRGRHEAGNWLFSWWDARIIDFFGWKTGWKKTLSTEWHFTRKRAVVQWDQLYPNGEV